jgi:hypothetical protein
VRGAAIARELTAERAREPEVIHVRETAHGEHAVERCIPASTESCAHASTVIGGSGFNASSVVYHSWLAGG